MTDSEFCCHVLKKYSRQAVLHQAGLYLLWDEKGLVYVGQSKDCARRVREHRRTKRFGVATMIPTGPDPRIRTTLEVRFIRTFRPKLNCHYGPRLKELPREWKR